MSSGVTYKDMGLSLPGFLHIRSLVIEEQPGKHSVMCVKAIMEPDMNEQGFYELPEIVSLNYILEGQQHILFKGVVSNSSLETEGGNRVLTLEVKDPTYWMDLDRKNRCFQNTEMTVSGVIGEIMTGYGGGASICNLPDEPIGEMIFQYEETDWEFLNRFISKYRDTLYPAAVYEEIHYQAGLSVETEAAEWDYLPYLKGKDLGRLAYLNQNGFPELLPVQFTTYQLDSYDVVSLGSQIPYKGSLWYVSYIRRGIHNGILKSTYILKQKEAMTVERYYNKRLTGISRYAIITNSMRDRVQAVMQQDLLGDSSYWFPFSSVSSSPDGSGWYCMPETGESARIYFPTEKEKDAYVITCIKGHAPQGESDPMGNPGVRSISAAGNLVQFNDDGISIAAITGNAAVDLKKDGTVLVSAPAGISLSPATLFTMSAKTITCTSTTALKITNASGADISAGPAGIFLHGQEIYEN